MSALDYLQRLEAESIHIFREVVAECEKPVMLYSVGKDSSVMLHLARKAFAPAKPPFPLLQIASGWDFREMLEFRDATAEKYGLELLVYTNEEGDACRRQALDSRRRVFRHHAHAGVAPGIGQVRLRCGIRRRPPRRGEEPRQGAGVLVPFRAAPLGPEESAPGTLVAVQRAQEPRREHPRIPAVELDRAGCVAVHPLAAGSHRAAVPGQAPAGGAARGPADHGRR